MSAWSVFRFQCAISWKGWHCDETKERSRTGRTRSLNPLVWPDWVWPWIGGGAAVLCELYFRTHRTTPYLSQWPAIPLTFLVNFAVYKIITGAPSWLAGFVAFSTVTLFLRILLTVGVLREAVSLRTWAALALLALAKGLVR